MLFLVPRCSFQGGPTLHPFLFRVCLLCFSLIRQAPFDSLLLAFPFPFLFSPVSPPKITSLPTSPSCAYLRDAIWPGSGATKFPVRLFSFPCLCSVSLNPLKSLFPAHPLYSTSRVLIAGVPLPAFSDARLNPLLSRT